MKTGLLSGGSLAALLLAASQARAVPFDYTGALQTYVVPTTGLYDITAYGAAGAENRNYSPMPSAGAGAEIGGEIMLTAGETLTVLVGGAGVDWSQVFGGGGGSFVVGPGNTPLVIAGGGGGGGYGKYGLGQTGRAGQGAYSMNNIGVGGPGGTNGGGGGGGGGFNGWYNYGTGGGGGGFLGNGGDGLGEFTIYGETVFPGTGGASFLNGGAGGFYSYSIGGALHIIPDGGFGGGGAGGHGEGGGGGGGYSGGGGALLFAAGGGGSYLAKGALDPLEVQGVTFPQANYNGYVSITYVPEPASAALLGAAVGGIGLLRRRRRA